MPREIAELPKGARVTDYISLGVIAEKIPRAKVNQVLQETGRASVRERELPAHVMVYYVIALALYMQSSYKEVLRCLREGLVWLFGREAAGKTAAKSAISQARTKLGVEPLRRLYEELVQPIATKQTRGAWYREWRLFSLDGSTLDVADTEANRRAFGKPSNHKWLGSYPQMRLAGLVENGTHVLLGVQYGGFRTGETVLARVALKLLKRGMLCLADRNFFGYELWKEAAAKGADLLWRVKKNLILPCLKRFSDGSYLSRIYPSPEDRQHNRNGIVVRVIEYTLEGVEEAEPFYRLLTTILDPERAPAEELAALYPERWEIENALDELKTHLRGARIVLRSKTPEGVAQELYGLLLAHFAIRGLMHEAALKADMDPDRLSFMHTVRVVRRKLPLFVALPP
jgi:DNA-binding PadR family transcriptional regulator